MRNGVVGLVFLAVFAPRVVSAQQRVPVIQLKPPDATLDEDFTFLSSVRELRDGRVIITDPRDRKFIVVDLKTGRIEPVGRQGSGPGEWTSAIAIHRLKGDSSIQMNFDRRWLLLDGARIVATMAPDAPVIVASRGFARGVDTLGYFMTVTSPPPRAGERRTGARDSLHVLRISRTSGHVDTIATVRDRPHVSLTRMDSTGRVTSSASTALPFGAGEEVVLFTDGWLAIARLDPYRVDWRAPDGRIIRGAPLPVPVLKLDEREKQAYLERIAKSREDASKMPPALRDLVARTRTELPATIPPFLGAAPLIGSRDGRLLIKRTVTVADSSSRYDIVNRRGILEGRIVLPKNERIAAFGAKHVYVVWKDEDDIERLRRHPWLAEQAIRP